MVKSTVPSTHRAVPKDRRAGPYEKGRRLSGPGGSGGAAACLKGVAWGQVGLRALKSLRERLRPLGRALLGTESKRGWGGSGAGCGWGEEIVPASCPSPKQPRGQLSQRGEERLSVAVRAGVHQTAPEALPAPGAAPRRLVQAPSWGACMMRWAEAAPGTQHPELWGCFLGTRVSRLQDASGQAEGTGVSLQHCGWMGSLVPVLRGAGVV